ncbi:MAG: DUF302 domain-containing protein [Thioalkalispiraceae bacterium]|jgi:uncharacterized protein (DUF302 family)
MLKRTAIILFCTLIGAAVSTSALAGDNGLIKKKSAYSVKVTIDRLEGILKKKGIGIAVRWNHAAKAKGVGMNMRDTEILIFGNPKMGSPLMLSNQEIGIDLPMKALAYKDAKGQVWLVYNDPAYLKKRHGITDKDAVFKKMTGALDKMTTMATSKK